MKIYILGLFLSFNFLYAGLINGIAVLVNNAPITLYDIDQKMLEKKMTQKDAINSLVDEKIYEQELSKNNIGVDIFDVDNYIEKLAAQNKMNVLDFKSLVRQQQDYEQFKSKIKEQLLHQKLIQKIAAGKLKIATKDDIEIVYKNNIKQYQIADTIEVIAYVSKNKALLEKIKLNPMIQDENVLTQTITLKQNELNPQIKYILNTTAEKVFTAVFAQNKNYNMFFIKEKRDIVTLSQDEVKDQIFQTIMKQREQNYLAEYFETLKITADIKVLR